MHEPHARPGAPNKDPRPCGVSGGCVGGTYIHGIKVLVAALGPLKQDHVGSIPTASTVGVCVRGVVANMPPSQDGVAGASPAGCSG